MAAHKIVRQVCRWQVDDGASMGIWSDKWLFEPSTSRVLFRPNTIPPNSRVNSLIDIHTCEWRTELVKQVFHPDDACSILAITLSNRLPYDKVVWAYTPMGKFIVRSAYKLALAEFVNNMGETSNNKNHKIFWRKFWGLNLPNKIKTFTWRLCRNILPAKENLCMPSLGYRRGYE